MTINGALEIGRSGLTASSVATEVAGNNLANVATRNYHRQVVSLAPTPNQEIQHGIFEGRGVHVAAIVRQVNEALEARLRNGIADEAGSAAQRDVLTQIEALHNELSDIDLSTRLSEFFNVWSNLANQPLDVPQQNLVIQEGRSLATFIRDRRTSLVEIRTQLDRALDDATGAANDLLMQIENINDQIVRIEGGTKGAHALRDQRDALFQELAEFLDISIVESESGRAGAADAFVQSLPIVLNGTSRGLEIRRKTVNGEAQTELIISDDGSVLSPDGGKLAGLLAASQTDLGDSIQTLDTFANHLIFEVNRVHSQGQGRLGYGQITGTARIDDATVALTDAAAGLNFTPQHGSFEITMTQKSTGQDITQLINVDLDGIGNDSTLESVRSSLDSIANLAATITTDGRLQLTPAGSDFEITFGRDSSGFLAAVGLNTYFAGSDATDIDVSSEIDATSVHLATGLDRIPGDNRTALAIAGLRDRQLDSTGSLSLIDFWNNHVEDFAVRLGQAEQQFEADTIVRENLAAQQQQISGVNSDEEAINLLSFQRAFQASARFLNVVDEMIQTLLSIG